MDKSYSSDTYSFRDVISKGEYGLITDVIKQDHPNECIQDLIGINQRSWRDVRLPNQYLVDNESELRGLTRNLSKVPETRYTPGRCIYDKKPGCFCASCIPKNVLNVNPKTCTGKNKIIHYKPRVNIKSCSMVGHKWVCK